MVWFIAIIARFGDRSTRSFSLVLRQPSVPRGIFAFWLRISLRGQKSDA